MMLLIADSSHAQAQRCASADAARALAYGLERSGEQAAAAEDPTAPGTFVAALYLPRFS